MATPTRTKPSHHLLRRTARKVARRYNEQRPLDPFRPYYRAHVTTALRGPYRYRVELRLHEPPRSAGGTRFVA